MSPSSPQHEPTMEEILASIRKIISEDSNEQQPAVQPRPQEADVLELTQEVAEEPAPPPPPAQVVQAAPPPPPPPADDIVFQPLEETPVSAQAQPTQPSSDGIFSDKARKALSDAFTSLEPEEPEHRPAPSAAPAPVAPIEGHTLEALFDQAIRATFDPVLHSWLDQNKDAVVERMKPVITQWLDEHFPAMLEDAVREELARARTKAKR